jgi:hypothetical protein
MKLAPYGEGPCIVYPYILLKLEGVNVHPKETKFIPKDKVYPQRQSSFLGGKLHPYIGATSCC